MGGEIFRTRPHLPWGPSSLLYNGYRDFPWGKAARAWRRPPTPSSAQVKKRIELYLYSPLWAFMACSRVTFTFTLIFAVCAFVSTSRLQCIKTHGLNVHYTILSLWGCFTPLISMLHATDQYSGNTDHPDTDFCDGAKLAIPTKRTSTSQYIRMDNRGFLSPVARGVQLDAAHPLQIWMRPLWLSKISKTNTLISPINNVLHPTASTCRLCWTRVVMNTSLKIYIYIYIYIYISRTWDKCHISKSVIFQERLWKVLKY